MKRFNDLITRSISGLLFVILVTASIFLGQYCFAVLFLAVNLYTCWEFRKLLMRIKIRLCLPTLMISASLLFISGFLHTEFGIRWGYFLTMISIFAIMITELYRNRLHAIHNVGLAVFAIFYISLPFTMLLYFPQILTRGNSEWQPLIVFMPFFIVWLNDTFAYLFGITLGKHRLFERISPKKSWEGTIGGGVVAVIGGTLITLYVDPGSLLNAVIISIIVVIFGTFGDLFESMMKRTIEVKDSGNIMPGHGGLLDRMDSLLFAIPAVFIYIVLAYLII